MRRVLRNSAVVHFAYYRGRTGAQGISERSNVVVFSFHEKKNSTDDLKQLLKKCKEVILKNVCTRSFTSTY